MDCFFLFKKDRDFTEKWNDILFGEANEKINNRLSQIYIRYNWYLLLKNLGGDFNGYDRIKDKKVIEIMAYLDVLDKYNRIEKIKEVNKKESEWKSAFGQVPQKIN